jgi:hypothetical protein
VGKKKFQFLYRASMTDARGPSSHRGEAEHGNQLVNKDDHANGRDKPSQERTTENAIQKAQAKQAHDKNGGTSNTNSNAGDPGMHRGIIVVANARINAALYDGAHQK